MHRRQRIDAVPLHMDLAARERYDVKVMVSRGRLRRQKLKSLSAPDQRTNRVVPVGKLASVNNRRTRSGIPFGDQLIYPGAGT